MNKSAACVVLTAIALPCRPAAAQGWAQLPVTGPSARAQAAMAFDAQRGVAVLHGGLDLGGGKPDTWIFDGTQWQLRSAGPSRRLHALAFDSVRGRVVLFGGYDANNATASDTWEWNGNSWLQRHPSVSPPARTRHAMAFDAARGRTVLFGGYLLSPPSPWDTWEWDGSNWTARPSLHSPSPRDSFAMAYDSLRARIVLFGGRPPDQDVYYSDTWEWDGTDWTQRSSSQAPMPRIQHQMVYDSNRSQLLLYGGHVETAPGVRRRLGDTWLFDGMQWSCDVFPGSPYSRSEHAMAYDSTHGYTLMFGGRDYYGGLQDETWEHGGTSVVAGVSQLGAGCGAPALALGSEGSSRPLLNATLVTAVTAVPGGQAFLSLGTNRWLLGRWSLPLPLDGLGMPGCWLHHNCDVALLLPCALQAPGHARHDLPIPGYTGLLGMQLFMQAWAPAPGVNAIGAVTSNAIELRIGNQ